MGIVGIQKENKKQWKPYCMNKWEFFNRRFTREIILAKKMGKK